MDEVTDIIDIENTHIESPPDTINQNLKQYVDKIYKRDQGLVILLNIEEIVNIKGSIE